MQDNVPFLYHLKALENRLGPRKYYTNSTLFFDSFRSLLHQLCFNSSDGFYCSDIFFIFGYY